MRRLVVNITTSEDRAQQTHRTVLTNPEWPNMFGTGLERLWSRLSFWLRHHAALREGLHSDRTIIRTLCSACTRARWWWNCKQGDDHSATLPPTLRFVLLIPRMLLCMASGPLAPSPPPQLTEGGSPSLPVSPRPRGNLSLTARERGLRGINPRRTSGHKTARKRYHHPALCIWAWPGRCHVRLARPRPTATPHTASH